MPISGHSHLEVSYLPASSLGCPQGIRAEKPVVGVYAYLIGGRENVFESGFTVAHSYFVSNLTLFPDREYIYIDKQICILQ